MSRAYSECPATSIVTRRTTFLIAQAVTAALRNCEIRRKSERHAPRKIERFDHPDAAPEKVDNPEVHSGDAPIDVLRGVQVESATVSGISIRVGFAYAVNGRQVKSAREGTRKVGHLDRRCRAPGRPIQTPHRFRSFARHHGGHIERNRLRDWRHRLRRRRSLTSSVLVDIAEQRQVNRVGHHLVPDVIRMYVVAAVVGRKQA